ncbi:MAG: tRNA uridine(34) 5-carboxymethylaminomethyl modification radical SAM/GNAT enzyme Elp3 [Candidatus Micrarchaeota archaeon]|nr:tRNA uridine(34) 5-carboxymethylaminomethyl modification radical SAM/GNAT enzyme Elp3 [Candidatus Micrarchaeota archaeon]
MPAPAQNTIQTPVQLILDEIERQKPSTADELIAIKKLVGKRFGLADVISNAELLEASGAKRKELEKLLKIRHVRSLSGVSVIAIMTKPAGCPGKCVYCPGGVTSPKSYTGFEPAAQRAKQNNYDAYRQVQNRLTQLEAIGHYPEKCDVIVMGATFNAFPRDYQHEFVKGAFDGFNGSVAKTIEESQKINETAKHRVIGLTFETRPDWCSEDDVKWFLSLGATRIELGIQSLDEAVLKKIERGHGVQESIDATQRCKDSFLKVCHHFMPGTFSNPNKDVAMFRRLFEDEAFCPDMIKIYPCLVLPNTPLYEMWKRGEFEPYNSETAADVIARCKEFIPPWCRVMRVDRDIPTTLVAAGVKNSNLREMVQKKCEEYGIKCKCIRCREAGLVARSGKVPAIEDAKLKRINYQASGGEEVFLSFEAEDVLYGFCRLRKPGKPFISEIDSRTCGIRELHVYGDQVPIGGSGTVQHHGLGKALLQEAEKIASEEFDANKLLVISGVGAKQYYEKIGFKRMGTYMGKIIR